MDVPRCYTFPSLITQMTFELLLYAIVFLLIQCYPQCIFIYSKIIQNLKPEVTCMFSLVLFKFLIYLSRCSELPNLSSPQIAWMITILFQLYEKQVGISVSTSRLTRRGLWIQILVEQLIMEQQ